MALMCILIAQRHYAEYWTVNPPHVCEKYVQLNSNTPVSFSYSLSVDGCYNTMITDQEDA